MTSRRPSEADTADASPVPFDRFMADALYGPNGFYSSGGRAGRRGDFITSPEVGPLFGAVVARFVRHEWTRLGRPLAFTETGRASEGRQLFDSVGAPWPESK